MNTVEAANYQMASLLSHSILDLHILPTEKCNFRCTYCYEDFQIGKMAKPIITGVKNLILNRISELKQLRISWFGGEPLAALDVVLEISHYAKELAEKNACAYHFGMTTNGYLLDEKRFTQLVAAGVNAFQISLDGTESFHNQTRLRADGAGTFDKIWNNLIAIAKTKLDFEIILRVHVTPSNHHSIADLLHLIKKNFYQDSRFKIFLKAIANLGGPNGGSFDVLSGQTKAKILTELHNILGEGLQAHELNKPNKPYVCYASAQNAWVIRANGTLAKCTVAFDDERNKIGFLHENGMLSLEQDKIQLWLRGLKTNDANIMGCPAYKLPPLAPNEFKKIPVIVQ